MNVDSSKSSRGDTHVKLVSKTSSDAVRQEDASAKVAAALDAKLREIQSERSSLVELPLLSATSGDEEDVKVSLSNDTSSSTKEVETTLPSKDDVEVAHIFDCVTLLHVYANSYPLQQSTELGSLCISWGTRDSHQRSYKID